MGGNLAAARMYTLSRSHQKLLQKPWHFLILAKIFFDIFINQRAAQQGNGHNLKHPGRDRVLK
jgi:hypothetical protein